MLFPDKPGTLHKEIRMADFARSPLTILRRKQVEAETGFSRSTIYLRITQGLWPRPVTLGPRSVGWPAHEVEALISARIAGKTDEDVRALVARLAARRASAHER